ncbi:MAG: hypothetical protein JSR60_17050 [Proteobacteria bacterium]|nr:hypothetical protein [Pseudomonadota bacterium]
MNKLPVGQVIRQAYAFAFQEIGTVIGLIWVPTVIQAAVNFFVLRAYYPAVADALESGAAPAGSVTLLPFLLIVVTLIAFSMIAVALCQQVMGIRQGPAFAHLAFGAAELKVFGNFFLLYGLLTLFLFLLILATGVAMAAGPGAVAVTVCVGFGALIYAAARLSFLLVPAVLDGSDIGFIRSWRLTGGNFWRIVGVGIATLAPIALVVDLITSVLLGPGSAPQGAAPTTLPDLMKAIALELRAAQPNLPILVGVALFLSPLTYALAFTPAAFAYRAMTGKTVFGGSVERG